MLITSVAIVWWCSNLRKLAETHAPSPCARLVTLLLVNAQCSSVFFNALFGSICDLEITVPFCSEHCVLHLHGREERRGLEEIIHNFNSTCFKESSRKRTVARARIGKNGVAGNRTQNLLHSVMLRRAMLRRCHTTRPQPQLMKHDSVWTLHISAIDCRIMTRNVLHVRDPESLPTPPPAVTSGEALQAPDTFPEPHTPTSLPHHLHHGLRLRPNPRRVPVSYTHLTLPTIYSV